MEPIGSKIRKARRRLGLTLDELAGRSGVSKPYLSLIETGRVANPPSDEKLRRLEQVLGFASGELVSQAHLLRTPKDIRAVLARLAGEGARGVEHAPSDNPVATDGRSRFEAGNPVDLDQAYLAGVLHQLVDRRATNIESVRVNAVPIVNRVSAGYPKDFTDLSYPRGVADEYLGCPDLADPDAFAARVHGDSMQPKYRPGDIVIFSPAAAPRHGDDCFIRFEDGQTTFKRVFFESDDSSTPVLRLQPRNEKYPPRVVRPEEVTGVYRAVFRYMSVDDD